MEHCYLSYLDDSCESIKF